MTHIGSGYATEADASLDVLSDLVESHPDIMAPFAIFIKVSLSMCKCWKFFLNLLVTFYFVQSINKENCKKEDIWQFKINKSTQNEVITGWL